MFGIKSLSLSINELTKGIKNMSEFLDAFRAELVTLGNNTYSTKAQLDKAVADAEARVKVKLDEDDLRDTAQAESITELQTAAKELVATLKSAGATPEAIAAAEALVTNVENVTNPSE